jgi:endonuclease/exonuclease/phosphatase family metal-dependent hydrolase
MTGLSKRFFSAVEYPGDGYIGEAFLTRFPIVSSEKVLLPRVDGQQRILGLADIEVAEGVVITFAVTHLSPRESEKQVQAEAVAAALDGRERVILLGDMSDVPSSEPIATLSATLPDQWPRLELGDEGPTYPAGSPDQRMDYIFASAAFPPPPRGKVVSSPASDHLPVVLDLVLP